VTKYRHPVIKGEIKKRLNEIINYIFSEKWGCNILSVGGEEDHIHILFEAPPQIQLSVLANNFKTVSSRHLRKEFVQELAPFYWKPYFWSNSYFVCTVSERSTAIVSAYIENQTIG
jgi:putative transposase